MRQCTRASGWGRGKTVEVILCLFVWRVGLCYNNTSDAFRLIEVSIAYCTALRFCFVLGFVYFLFWGWFLFVCLFVCFYVLEGGGGGGVGWVGLGCVFHPVLLWSVNHIMLRFEL